ncbi:hypothetical protein DMC14_002560 [Metamycoplasma phocicerebrale]|uniref:Uncharacterized protein n=1 Tax=Metamycoplasma phocicerebrale TaxID=142649 RepID=A0A3Q9V8Q5_9BACT|nr:hypothetical protein [Metamycoplasma phocicerebrale]AZZ65652.1 hypothetical protein DMC14_002560 [Metamycoplasma phocicerebrale]
MDRSDIKSINIKLNNKNVYRYSFRGDSICEWPYHPLNIAMSCIEGDLETFKKHFKYEFPKQNLIKIWFKPNKKYALISGRNRNSLQVYLNEEYTITIDKRKHFYKEWNQEFKKTFERYENYLDFITKNSDKKMNFYEYKEQYLKNK